ncbi:MAG: hypothetical protein QOE18_498, partial [Chloroflexota bacterium]|nr:hypothetical protein [Chloroflexota bacterium]
QPSFCDLEEHNALTAHQERTRLAGEGGERGDSVSQTVESIHERGGAGNGE